VAGRAAAADYAGTVGPTIEALHAQGLSLRQIAAQMAERNIRTPLGGTWTASAVRSVLLRRQAANNVIPQAP
jgi:hypothetical protein